MEYVWLGNVTNGFSVAHDIQFELTFRAIDSLLENEIQ